MSAERSAGAIGAGGDVAGPRARPARAVDRLGRRVRRLLGIRQAFFVGGVWYREVTTEPLRRALSRKGSGRKEYDVRFGDGSSMRIAATAMRHYEDLVGPRGLEVWRAVESLLTPGMRVAALESGTGYVGAWLAERVGPSGAVVALDRDAESIRYAQARYPARNIAYEVGGAEALTGEVDGAFDAVLVGEGFEEAEDREAAWREAWRVVGPGGWLVLVGAEGEGEGLAASVRAAAEGAESVRTIGRDDLGGRVVVVAARGEESV